MQNRLTIFTPTYNRSGLLANLYNSLKCQTNNNFVWLVVDDGSTDNTEQVINSFIEEGIIKIDYHKKTNGGKHTAMEVAHSICQTEFMACVDSDDYLTEDAINEIYLDLENVSEQDLGIVYRRAVNPSTPFNSKWPMQNTKLYFHELADKYGYNEDTFLVFRTSIVKNCHFPKIEDERFVTERVLYYQFMFDYKMLAVDKLIYIGEYQEDGYTAGSAKLMFKNPKGVFYAFKSDTYYLTKYKMGIKQVLFAWARYYSWKRIHKFKNLYKEELNIKSIYKFLGWIISPIFYIRYRKKQKALNK